MNELPNLPPEGTPVVIWDQRDQPHIAHWSRGEAITDWDGDPPAGSMWDDDESTLYAPPGWWVHSHWSIDGGEHAQYWLCAIDVPVRWSRLPRIVEKTHE